VGSDFTHFFEKETEETEKKRIREKEKLKNRK